MPGEVGVSGAVAFSCVVISEICDFLHNASTELLLRLLPRFYKYRVATLVRTAVVVGSHSMGSRADALKVCREKCTTDCCIVAVLGG